MSGASVENATGPTAERTATLLQSLSAKEISTLPTNAAGEPEVQIVRALFRHEQQAAHKFSFVQIRELGEDEWDRVMDCHRLIHQATRPLGVFPLFAWGDLRIARDEVLRQLRDNTWTNEWLSPLIEHRMISFSTSLKLYHEQALAVARRAQNASLFEAVEREFSVTYDGSFGYRLIYSLRNAFQHGARDLMSLHMSVTSPEPDAEPSATLSALLDKEKFVSGRTNAAVRAQVRGMGGDIDLLALAEDAYARVLALNSRLLPILHPRAHDAGQTVAGYMREAGNERAHFHEYIRGLPTRILGITSVDKLGFAYILEQIGARGQYDADGPPEVLDVLPTYKAQPTSHSVHARRVEPDGTAYPSIVQDEHDALTPQ